MIDEVYKLRATEMLAMQVRNRSLAEIAAHFNCSTSTVSRSIEWLQSQGIVQQLENRIITELAGPALEIYKELLAKKDKQIAMDVVSKIVKIGERFNKVQTSDKQQGLVQYMAMNRKPGDKHESAADKKSIATNVAGTLRDSEVNTPPQTAPGTGEIGNEHELPSSETQAAAISLPVEPLQST